MNKIISDAMAKAVWMAIENGGAIVRHPGGRWCGETLRKEESAGTQTVQSLVDRRVMVFSKYHNNTHGRIPVEAKIRKSEVSLIQILLDSGFVATEAGGGCVGYVQNVGSLEVWISDVDHPHVPDSFPCGIKALRLDEHYKEVNLGDHHMIVNADHLKQVLRDIEAMPVVAGGAA